MQPLAKAGAAWPPLVQTPPHPVPRVSLTSRPSWALSAWSGCVAGQDPAARFRPSTSGRRRGHPAAAPVCRRRAPTAPRPRPAHRCNPETSPAAPGPPRRECPFRASVS